MRTSRSSGAARRRASDGGGGPVTGRPVFNRTAAIVGIGQSAYGKALPGTAWELAMEAVLAACADAGVDVAEVDGMCRFTAPFEPVTEAMLVRGLGIPELSFFAQAPHGGEALGAVVMHAAGAVSAGLASTVVVYRALSQSRGGRFGRADGRGPGGGDAAGRPGADIVVPEQDNLSFAWPYGLMSPAQLFALWARRYAAVHGLSDENLTQALGTIAITQRQYANRNPNAMMRDRKLDWEGYRGARMISEPLRLFDLCLENDGACAFVVTTADRARALRPDPVWVLSATQTISPYREPMGIYPSGELLELFPPAAADRLFERAGVNRADIDVAEFYDATSYMPLRSLESYGFVPDGQAWRYVTEQGTGPGSPLPVNTHGGHLSEAYLHGMNGILEAVRQLRGTAVNQVPDADVALVGAPAGSATILAR
ncbi:MAG: thiolase C-terminal domain-containing protein [Trebonia sp.]